MKRTSAAVLVATLGVLAAARAWWPASPASGSEQVIRLTASKFVFTPNEIMLEKGVPAVIEITSLDRDHGFKVPELGIRADVKPGRTTRVRLVPERTGRFAFRCDVFCGTGHEDMDGEIVVVDPSARRAGRTPDEGGRPSARGRV